MAKGGEQISFGDYALQANRCCRVAVSRRQGGEVVHPVEVEGGQAEVAENRAGRPLEIDWQESIEELEALYYQEKNGHKRVRLRAFLLLRAGDSLIEVSESEKVSYRTLKRWVAWYRTGGLQEVLSRTPGSVVTSPVAREGN